MKTRRNEDGSIIAVIAAAIVIAMLVGIFSATAAGAIGKTRQARDYVLAGQLANAAWQRAIEALNNKQSSTDPDPSTFLGDARCPAGGEGGAWEDAGRDLLGTPDYSGAVARSCWFLTRDTTDGGGSEATRWHLYARAIYNDSPRNVDSDLMMLNVSATATQPVAGSTVFSYTAAPTSLFASFAAFSGSSGYLSTQLSQPGTGFPDDASLFRVGSNGRVVLGGNQPYDTTLFGSSLEIRDPDAVPDEDGNLPPAAEHCTTPDLCGTETRVTPLVQLDPGVVTRSLVSCREEKASQLGIPTDEVVLPDWRASLDGTYDPNADPSSPSYGFNLVEDATGSQQCYANMVFDAPIGAVDGILTRASVEGSVTVDNVCVNPTREDAEGCGVDDRATGGALQLTVGRDLTLSENSRLGAYVYAPSGACASPTAGLGAVSVEGSLVCDTVSIPAGSVERRNGATLFADEASDYDLLSGGEPSGTYAHRIWYATNFRDAPTD